MADVILNVVEEKVTLEVAGDALIYGRVAEAKAVLDRINDFTTGPTGPANSTYSSLTTLKAAPATNRSYILTTPTRKEIYSYVEGDFTGQADDYRVVKLDGVPLSTGALKRFDGPLYAENFGVVGNGLTDDTAAAQAFISLCNTLGRTANFGSARVRVSGPLRAASTNVVFEPFSYGAAGEPGFYATGSGYTVLTVFGFVSDFCVTVFGGEISYDGSDNLVADNRPAINGVRFGELTSSSPLAASTIRSVRVRGLNGFGIRHDLTWDSTFISESVEHCGSESWYAWSTESGGGATCNETVWLRVQVEQSHVRAMYVSPETLSCQFGKIHSESTHAKAGFLTWQFGPGNYTATRLTAFVPARADVRIVAETGSFTGLRVEGGIPVRVSTGGALDFVNLEGSVLTPDAGSNGAVNVHGGLGAIVSAGIFWNLFGFKGPVSIGELPAGYMVELIGCDVTLSQTSSAARVSVVGGTTALIGGAWNSLSFSGGAQVTYADTLANCALYLDATSRITGNITLNRVGARINGRIVGNFTHGTNSVLFGALAEVSGTITNHGPPLDGLYLDGLKEGMSCKNLRPTLLGTTGGQYIIQGWQYAGGAFRECRAATGT